MMSTIESETKSHMEKACQHLKDELSNLRTNRPSPALLENISVEAYGTEMKIRDLGSVSVVDGRQLLISPFDPQTAPMIRKGIEKANLNVQPHLDGNVVRVSIPEMSEEVRKGIAKEAKEKAEKAKITIRECRRKANDTVKKLKSDGEIAEDEQKRSEKQVQELTDDFCKQIETLYVAKEKEILSV